MTLIASYASHYFSVSVSDRLVTVSGNDHDTLSNKVVVCLLPDAFLTIGYTGLAFIDGIPTDEWLVSQLVPTTQRRTYISVNAERVPRRVGSIVARLVVALRKRVQGLRNDLWKYGLQVGIAGCHAPRADMWPFLLIISKPEYSDQFTFQLLPHHPDTNYRKFAVWISGGWAHARRDLFEPLFSQLAVVSSRSRPRARDDN